MHAASLKQWGKKENDKVTKCNVFLMQDYCNSEKRIWQGFKMYCFSNARLFSIKDQEKQWAYSLCIVHIWRNLNIYCSDMVSNAVFRKNVQTTKLKTPQVCDFLFKEEERIKLTTNKQYWG